MSPEAEIDLHSRMEAVYAGKQVTYKCSVMLRRTSIGSTDEAIQDCLDQNRIGADRAARWRRINHAGNFAKHDGFFASSDQSGSGVAAGSGERGRRASAPTRPLGDVQSVAQQQRGDGLAKGAPSAAASRKTRDRGRSPTRGGRKGGSGREESAEASRQDDRGAARALAPSHGDARAGPSSTSPDSFATAQEDAYDGEVASLEERARELLAIMPYKGISVHRCALTVGHRVTHLGQIDSESWQHCELRQLCRYCLEPAMTPGLASVSLSWAPRSVAGKRDTLAGMQSEPIRAEQQEPATGTAR